MTEQPPPRPDAEQLAAVVVQLADTMRAYVAALAPAMAAMGAAVQSAARNARQVEYALAPPPDRPAWQSPHGPAHTHRTK